MPCARLPHHISIYPIHPLPQRSPMCARASIDWMGIIDASMSIIDATATPGHDALSKIGPFSQIGAFQRYNRDKCTVSILPQICGTYQKLHQIVSRKTKKNGKILKISVIIKLQQRKVDHWAEADQRKSCEMRHFQLKTFANWRHFGAADRSEIILHSFSSICVWLLTADHINHNCGIARLRIKKQQKQSLSYKQGNTFKIKYYQFLSLEGIVDSVSCLCVERFLMGVDSNLMSATTRGDINHHHSSSSSSPSKIYWRKLAPNGRKNGSLTDVS